VQKSKYIEGVYKIDESIMKKSMRQQSASSIALDQIIHLISREIFVFCTSPRADSARISDASTRLIPQSEGSSPRCRLPVRKVFPARYRMFDGTPLIRSASHPRRKESLCRVYFPGKNCPRTFARALVTRR